jgi:hypothetical protein
LNKEDETIDLIFAHEAKVSVGIEVGYLPGRPRSSCDHGDYDLRKENELNLGVRAYH